MATSSELREKARRNQEATNNFFVVRFQEDGFIAVTPGKAIQQPLPVLLSKGSDCEVKWSDKKVYKATVLAIEGM